MDAVVHSMQCHPDVEEGGGDDRGGNVYKSDDEGGGGSDGDGGDGVVHRSFSQRWQPINELVPSGPFSEDVVGAIIPAWGLHSYGFT